MINVGKRKISLILLTLFLLPSVSSLFTTGQCDVQDITLMNQNVPRSPETAETGTDMVFIPNTTPESYPEEDEPMDISYSTTRTDGADEIPYTFFSIFYSVQFITTV